MIKRLISFFVCVTFFSANFQYADAQFLSVNQLPVPGAMIGESTPFAPLSLKGLVINPRKPLEFQFIMDTGKGPRDTASIKEEANRLVKYFLAGLTIPEGELWVNLSPYEKDRMTTPSLGQTELGRDLLAQDYILKQLTASLIYPEKDLGKEFWNRVYTKAQKQFGTTNVPVNTFNKVWILPDEAQIFEHGPAAYVTQSTLKVMLDEDYLAKQKHLSIQASSVSSEIIRQIVIPEITKEVNSGKNFAPLRQIYGAMILAKWYKETIANGLLDALYTNRNKVGGIDLLDPTIKEQIYRRYLQAYKRGVFDFIKDTAAPDGQKVARKYFSGGFTARGMKLGRDGAMSAVKPDGAEISLIFDLRPVSTTVDAAMFLPQTRLRWILNGNTGEALKDSLREFLFEGNHLFLSFRQVDNLVRVVKTMSINSYPGTEGKVNQVKAYLAELMDAVENRGQYESYTKLSDALHTIDPTQGNDVYKDFGHPEHVGQKSGFGQIKKIVFGQSITERGEDWRKVRRDEAQVSSTAGPRKADAAMIEQTYRVLGHFKRDVVQIKMIRSAYTKLGIEDPDPDMEKYLEGIFHHLKLWLELILKNARLLMDDPEVETLILELIIVYIEAQSLRSKSRHISSDEQALRQKIMRLTGIKAHKGGIVISDKLSHQYPYAAQLVSSHWGQISREIEQPESLARQGLIASRKNMGLSNTTRIDLWTFMARYYLLWIAGDIPMTEAPTDHIASDAVMSSDSGRGAESTGQGRIQGLGVIETYEKIFASLGVDVQALKARAEAKKRSLVEKINSLQLKRGDPIEVHFGFATGYLSEGEQGVFKGQYIDLKDGELHVFINGRTMAFYFRRFFYTLGQLILRDVRKDRAMLPPGGIDLNQIAIQRSGHVIKVQFDPAQLAQLEQGDFEGFTPVMTGFQYITSPLPILGIK